VGYEARDGALAFREQDSDRVVHGSVGAVAGGNILPSNMGYIFVTTLVLYAYWYSITLSVAA
jgi:hypothetical protein